MSTCMAVVFKASIFICPLIGGWENNVRASGKFSSLWAQLSSQKGEKKTLQNFHSEKTKTKQAFTDLYNFIDLILIYTYNYYINIIYSNISNIYW